MAIPTIYPDRFFAGDSISWRESHSDFPASAGWVLSYELRGKIDITLTATADGDGHLFEVTAAESADFAAGVYRFAAVMTNGSSRQTVRTGHMTVRPDPTGAGDGSEALSYEERVLAALKAAYEGNAGEDVAAYTIGGESVTRMSRERLTAEIEHYRRIVKRQKRERRKARGSRFSRIVKGVF